MKFERVLPKLSRVILIAASFFCILIIFYQSYLSILPFVKTLFLTFRLSNLSQEMKMNMSWGSFVMIDDLLDKHVNKNARFMYPPQTLDAWFGNGALMQYFMYPAKLYEENLDLIEDRKVDAILVRDNWPNFFVPIKKAYFSPIRTYVNIQRIDFEDAESNFTDFLKLDNTPELERVKGNESMVINAHSIDRSSGASSELLDFTVSETGEDIWIRKIDHDIDHPNNIKAMVRAGKNKLVSLILQVDFVNGGKIYLSSDRNLQTNVWEELSISDINNRVLKIGEMKGWSADYKISGIGINIGIDPNGPYYSEGIGIIENGFESLGVESSNLTAIDYYLKGLLEYRQGDKRKAKDSFEASILLNTSGTEANLLIAKILALEGMKVRALQHLRSSVEGNDDLWSGIELVSLLDESGYTVNKAYVEKLMYLYPESNYLSFELAKLYERLGMDIIAYRFYMLSTTNYPYSAISVKAAHKLNEIKKGNFANDELSIAKKYFLEGRFDESANIVAKLYAKSPKDTKLIDTLEDAYKIKEYGFDKDMKNGKSGGPSGILRSGLDLKEEQSHYAGISLKPVFFPNRDRGLARGTLEFYWQAEKLHSLNERNKYFLLDQIGSLGRFKPVMRMYMQDKKLWLSIRDINNIYPKNVSISSDVIEWEEGRWYYISVSWGDGTARLYIDKKLAGMSNYGGKVGVDPDLYLTLAPDKSPGSIFNPDEYEIYGVVDSFIIYSYQKKYDKGIETWN